MSLNHSGTLGLTKDNLLVVVSPQFHPKNWLLLAFFQLFHKSTTLSDLVMWNKIPNGTVHSETSLAICHFRRHVRKEDRQGKASIDSGFIKKKETVSSGDKAVRQKKTFFEGHDNDGHDDSDIGRPGLFPELRPRWWWYADVGYQEKRRYNKICSDKSFGN